MKKILTIDESKTVSDNLHKKGQKIVLAGGCFDILHIGHIQFLHEAKAKGDALFIMLEHDDVIKKKKGKHRPLNIQTDRAELLAALEMVDAVILMPKQTTDTVYDDLVNQLKPAIIATTAGDLYREHKERQAKKVGATVVDVIKPISNRSTTKLFTILNEL
jgi:rfaE bifunctional protein nucleotidyltransferase chain/domain